MSAVPTLISTLSGGAAGGGAGPPEESSQERWICGKGQCEFPVLKVLSSGQTTFLLIAQVMAIFVFCFSNQMSTIWSPTWRLFSTLSCMSSTFSVAIFRATSIRLVFPSNTSHCIMNDLRRSNAYCVYFVVLVFLGGGFSHLSARYEPQRDVQAAREGDNSQRLWRFLCCPRRPPARYQHCPLWPLIDLCLL